MLFNKTIQDTHFLLKTKFKFKTRQIETTKTNMKDTYLNYVFVSVVFYLFCPIREDKFIEKKKILFCLVILYSILF